MSRIKSFVFLLLQPAVEGPCRGLSRAVDCFIMALILVSVSSVFALTFELPPRVTRALMMVELIAALLFTVEYVLRVWTADLLRPELPPWRARLRYLCTGMAVIDLLAILPFWMAVLPWFRPVNLMSLRTLRLLRLLRLFKLNRYIDALQAVSDVFRQRFHQLMASMFFVMVLMVIASLLMYAVEHEAQPDRFCNAFSGFWWAVATLTTVGYGDIYPITVAGRLLGAVIALLGVGMVAIPTGILSSGFMEHLNNQRRATFDASDREQLKALFLEVLREEEARRHPKD